MKESLALKTLIAGIFTCILAAVLTKYYDPTTGGIVALLGIAMMILSMMSIPKFKPYIFTTIIFFAATLSMYFPHLFTSIGDFQFKSLIVPLLMVIMFCMGASMELSDFYGVIKMPKGVIVGLICQFSIMPLVGYTLAYVSKFEPEIAAGIILVGCSPSGLASNVMSYLAKANLALSLTLTMCATILAPIVTPFLMLKLAGQFVPIDAFGMFVSIVKIVILPVIAGLLLSKYLKKYEYLMNNIMPKMSMAAIVMVITIVTATGRESLLSIGLLLIALVMVHNILGYFLGYWSSRLVGMDIKSCRTIALEVGMQNGGLASGIAMEMGKIATLGLAPAVFGPFMNITGSTLASQWASNPPKEQ